MESVRDILNLLEELKRGQQEENLRLGRIELAIFGVPGDGDKPGMILELDRLKEKQKQREKHEDRIQAAMWATFFAAAAAIVSAGLTVWKSSR